MKTFIKATMFAVCLLVSTASNSASIDIIDNGDYTTDSISGLDWLDLTITRGMSYNQVIADINFEGTLSGWRYATVTELTALISNSQWRTDSNSQLWSYLGGTLAIGYADFINGIYGSVINSSVPNAQLYIIRSNGNRYFRPLNSYLDPDFANEGLGSFLVRETQLSAVPIPATAWLLTSALLGFFGLRGRAKQR